MLYLFSPWDLIPEFIFGILGYVDDFAILVYVVIAIGNTFFYIL